MLKRFWREKLALIGSLFLLIVAAAALLAPQITPYGPDKLNVRERFQPPNEQHWLGTDDLGRDVFSRLLHAGRTSLLLGLGAALLSLVIGSFLGSLAGYWGGWLDSLISMWIDTLLSVPVIAFAMAASAFLQLDTWKLILILALISWPTIARLVRGQVLSLKERAFVEAARAMGVSGFLILFKHIYPNTLAPVLVAGSLLVAFAILVESALSFLGFGIPPPTATWGRMLNDAQLYFRDAPWLAIFPGLAITLVVACINFVGEGLREALDPRKQN